MVIKWNDPKLTLKLFAFDCTLELIEYVLTAADKTKPLYLYRCGGFNGHAECVATIEP